MFEDGAVCVELTSDEIECAISVAHYRSISNYVNKYKNRYGHSEDYLEGINSSAMGCLGELAAAKYLNFYWSGLSAIKAIDVGSCCDVRARRDLPNRSLILHPADPDNLPMIAARVGKEVNKIWLQGWIYAREGKIEKYWRDPQKTNRFAFFIPDSDLRSMISLKPELNKLLMQEE